MAKERDRDQVVQVPATPEPEAFYAIRFGSGTLYTGGPQQGRYGLQEEAEDEALRLLGGHGPTSLGIVLVNIFPVGTVERQVARTSVRKRYVGDLPANQVGAEDEVDAVDDVRVRVEPDPDALYEEFKPQQPEEQ